MTSRPVPGAVRAAAIALGALAFIGVALIVVAALAAGWYVLAREPVRRSSVPPVALLGAGFAVKLLGLTMTGGERSACMADATVATSLAAALGITIWLVATTARAATRAARLRRADQLIEALRERGRCGPSSAPSN